MTNQKHMKFSLLKNLFFPCTVLLISLMMVVSCESQKQVAKVRFSTPDAGKIVRSGQPLTLKLELPAGEQAVDSIIYTVDGEKIITVLNSDSIQIDTDAFRFGSRAISARIFANGKEEATHTNIMLLPEAPQYYSFKVINEFPHSPDAFTQGLEFHGGHLYESTGQYGNSSLRRTRVEDGAVLNKIALDDRYFGEGLTIVGDRLIQLTWMENTGFVYDLKTLNKISEFRYGTQREGWGICYDGERLIKTDGSNKLYFLNKDTYLDEEIREVFNHQGPVKSLNELEYIDGLVYANVYMEDIIVIIDPQSGAVVGEINLIGIYPEKNERQYDNELNGIAYDRQNDRLFVTGKNWSKLFEIELVAR